MIFIELFFTFFKIGLFTVGGGYAMLPLIRTEVLSKGWLTAEEIAALARRWSAFSREANPGPNLGEEELEKLKKNSGMTRENGSDGGC